MLSLVENIYRKGNLRMKSKKAKKIVSISIITVVLAIMITVIVLACVPKRLYNPVNTGYNTISIWRNGESKIYINNPDIASDEDKSVVGKLNKLHDESLTSSILSGMFQGTSGYDNKVKASSNANLKNTLQKDGYTCIVFSYGSEQTLKFDGKDYIDETALSSTAVKYTKAILVVSNTETFEETILYLSNDSYESDYRVLFLSHQSELFSYIADLDGLVK